MMGKLASAAAKFLALFCTTRLLNRLMLALFALHIGGDCSAFAAPIDASQDIFIAETRYCVKYLTDLEAMLSFDRDRFEAVCTCRPGMPASLARCSPRMLSVVPLSLSASGSEHIPLTPGAQKEESEKIRGVQHMGEGAQQKKQAEPKTAGSDVKKEHLQKKLLTVKDVENHIGHAEDLSVVNLQSHYFSCVDGRSSDEVVGTWGGDAGEIMLALAAWEQVQERPLMSTQIAGFIRTYLRTSQQDFVYYHTDSVALAYVMDFVGVEDLDITSPPSGVRSQVLEALSHPLGQGCDHFKQLLQRPADYSVRKELVVGFMTAFHELLWDETEPLREKIQYYVLHAPSYGSEPHQEAAWLDFQMGPDCVKARRAAAFPPYSEDLSLFVHHPQAVEAKRNATAGLVSKASGLGRPTIRYTLLKKGTEWDKRTEEAVVPPGLPRYIVTAS